MSSPIAETPSRLPRSAPSGALHRWSRTLIPTSKDAPAEAQAVSHRLLVRAGYIRQVGAGIYDYLPLAWRVLQKVSQIVREEMDAAGASEMLMPALEPIELFAGTKRDVDYGDNLFRLEDRHGRTVALAPTHEEIITEMMKGSVSSYKQLPLNLYQIQTKFRDEFRPRSGLLRCREFIMKDAYSFHLDVEGEGGLNEAYDAMHRAYVNVFTRCGLDFTVVEAESGPIGGSASHEFMVNCESGEDTILVCPVSGYAANVEKCETGDRPHDFGGEPTGALEKVHTPNMPGIDEVGKFMKVKPDRMLKTLVFQRTDVAEGAPARWVLAVVRADHDVNEGKVRDAAGGHCVMADDKAAKASGFAIGYVSPRALLGKDGAPRADTLLIVDPDAAQVGFWATGADEADHHVKHFNWRREMGAALDDSRYVKVADARNAVAGDPSPRAAGATLEAKRGIEVGHIFKLGAKYSDAMGFQILDASQQRRSVIMGCYGIGVSRTMAACVEMSSDENGIVWPASIAPYHVHIVPMKVETESDAMRHAMEIGEKLRAAGFDVLVDDRDERPGVKFKDADLIGCPVRLTLGDKAIEQGCVEFKARTDTGKGELVKFEDAVAKCLEAVGG
ncbi:MAG: proline--tRNA ligase [Phycisphaerales bacterium]|nr:MAG: proline--tRNA ligase [Phycisphaerales bacterium]